jgi:alpha-L-rhamnosidase
LVVNAPYWEFTDWANGEGWSHGVAPKGKDGISAAVNLQLCIAYQMAADLEDQLGSRENASAYSAKYQNLKTAILATFWNESMQLFSDTSEKRLYSQHVNILAVHSGLVEGNKATSLVQKVLQDTSLTRATIYFQFYLHEAMAKSGLGNFYLDQLNDWREQIRNGLTTWAEISDHNVSRSDCHAWGASPNVEFFKIVLGITSDAPGFKKVRIAPNPGKLTSLRGSIPHPRGNIRTEMWLKNGVWEARIDLPKALEGQFLWNDKSYPLYGGENLLTLK